MSEWRTIVDPRNSTKIELYSKLGVSILEYYEKHQKFMIKQQSQNPIWDKIVNPESKRKVLLTGDKGTKVLIKYRNVLYRIQRRRKKQSDDLKIRQNLLSMKEKLKSKHVSKQKFKNPYLIKSQKLCMTTEQYLRKFNVENKIVIDEVILKRLGYKLKTSINIPIPNFTKDGPTIRKIEEYFKVFCGIYKKLGSEKVTRKDFFTNPGKKTTKVLTMFTGIKKKLIQYIFSFIGGGGGVAETGHFDVDNHYVDDFVAMLKTMEGVSAAPTTVIGESVYIPVAPTTALRHRRGTMMT